MTTPLRVLIVEDAEGDDSVIAQALRRGGFHPACERVESLALLSASLDAEAFDLVLVNYGMNGFNGLEALAILRERKLETPCIVVSRTAGEDVAAAAMKAGAHDYLLRDQVATRLVPSVQRELREAAARRERRKAEEALRESQRALSTLMSNLPGMAYRCRNDREWTMELVSEGVHKLTGYSPADLVDNRKVSFNQLIHPDDQARVWDAVQEALIQKVPYEIVYRIRTASGEEKSVWEQGRGVFSHDGRLTALEGFVTDITARRRAEEGREALQRLPQALSGASTVKEVAQAISTESRRIFRHDAFLLDLYDEATQMFVTVRAEDTAPGKTGPDEFDRPSVPRAAMAGNPAIGGEARLINRPTEPSASPLRAFGYTQRLSRSLMFAPIRWEGRVVGVISVQSYTPGRYTEPDLKLLEAFAEECGAAVTRVRMQDALRQSEEQLRHAQKMEALGRLAGGVAHEYNNLLTAMMGYGQLARTDAAAGRPVLGHVDQMLKSMERAASITRQLLAVSRKQVLDLRVVSVNALVEETSKILVPLLGEEVQLATALDPAAGNVRVDPAQVDQVLVCLASNARDAMPAGGQFRIETANVEIDAAYARTRPDARPGPHVVISAGDTGRGMDESTRAHLFEPFFTTKPNGDGLGLSTVYGVVRQCGGHVAVESTPDRGTTFRIYLPRVEAQAEGRRTPTVVALPSGGTETVLLVEDSDVVRQLAREVLEANGYRVLEARHGIHALQVSERHAETIHLLVTDVVMPEMGGPALAEKLAPKRPGLRVLFISGYADSGAGRGFTLPPRAAFLSKPFPPSELLRKVRKTLDAPLPA